MTTFRVLVHSSAMSEINIAAHSVHYTVTEPNRNDIRQGKYPFSLALDRGRTQKSRQFFNRREEAKFYIRNKSEKPGFKVAYVSREIGKGVFATRNFERGEYLLEYTGDLISNKEGKRREKQYPLKLGSFLFFFKYSGKNLCIDGTFSKTKGKFVNDAVGNQKNSTMLIITIQEKPHLCLFATKNIKTGTEIRYDYGVPNLPWRKKEPKNKKCISKMVNQEHDINDIDKQKVTIQQGVCVAVDEVDKDYHFKRAKQKRELNSKRTTENQPPKHYDRDIHHCAGTFEDMKCQHILQECIVVLERLEISNIIDDATKQHENTSIESAIKSDMTENRSEINKDITSVEVQTTMLEHGYDADGTDDGDAINLAKTRDESDTICAKGYSLNPSGSNSGKDNPDLLLLDPCTSDDATKKQDIITTESAIKFGDITKPIQEFNKGDITSVEVQTTMLEHGYVDGGTDDGDAINLTETRDESDAISAKEYSLNPSGSNFGKDNPDLLLLDPSTSDNATKKQDVISTESAIKFGDITKPIQEFNKGDITSVEVQTTMLENGYVDDGTDDGDAINLTETRDESDAISAKEYSLNPSGSNFGKDNPDLLLLDPSTSDNATKRYEVVSTESAIQFYDINGIMQELDIGESVLVEVHTDILEDGNDADGTDAINLAKTGDASDALCAKGYSLNPSGSNSGKDNPDLLLLDPCTSDDATKKQDIITTESAIKFGDITKPIQDFNKGDITSVEVQTTVLEHGYVDGGTDDGNAINLAETRDGSDATSAKAYFLNQSGSIISQDNPDLLQLNPCTSGKQSCQYKTTKTNRGKKPYRVCIFCGKSCSKLREHLSLKHKSEDRVKAALSMKKSFRDAAFDQMKKDGILLTNRKIMQDNGIQNKHESYQRERKQGTDTIVMCSICKGFYSRKYIFKHKQNCTSPQTIPQVPVSIPMDLINEVESKGYVETILSKFREDEVGNLCKKDPVIILYGRQEFIKLITKKEKKRVLREKIMSDMRTLGKLFVAFRELAEKKKVEVWNCEDMFIRTNFPLLQESILKITISETGDLKHGLKFGLGFLIKKTAKLLKGSYLCKKEDKKSEEIDHFLAILFIYWNNVFSDAHYKMKKSRQIKLRKPQQLPKEEDIYTLREFTVSAIAHFISDEYHFISKNDFVELRDLLICRLTMYNARRGGEPSRLLLEEWHEAETNSWISASAVRSITDPVERELLEKIKIAYQSGKNLCQMVPVLIPLDCVQALRKIADENIRKDAGVYLNNPFLFPSSSSSSDLHVKGWDAVKKICTQAGIKSNLTATGNRHRVSTIYSALDVPEQNRQLFYKHMGHSEEINRNVYQCPMAVQEITLIGKFLKRLDETIDTVRIKTPFELASGVKCTEEVMSLDENDDIDSDVEHEEPSASLGIQEQDDFDESEDDEDVEITDSAIDFLLAITQKTVVFKVLKGEGIIKDDEIKTNPEELLGSKNILLNEVAQKCAKKFFSTCGWQIVRSAILAVHDLHEIRKKTVKEKALHQNTERGETKQCSHTVAERISMHSEKEKTAQKPDRNCVDLSKNNRKTRHAYFVWNKDDEAIVKTHFKKFIYDVSNLDGKGKLPGRAYMRTFLCEQSKQFMGNVDDSVKIHKLYTKIFNERKKVRDKMKHTESTMLF